MLGDCALRKKPASVLGIKERRGAHTAAHGIKCSYAALGSFEATISCLVFLLSKRVDYIQKETPGDDRVPHKKKRASMQISRRTFLAAAASLPVLSLPWQPANAADFKPFSFVYLCDSHLTSGMADESFKLLQESQLFLQDTIKFINAHKPDFVIFGGDQVETIGTKNDENWQLFIDVAQSLNAPWSFVLGEQDVSGKNLVDKMKTFGLDFKGRGITSSEPYWSMDPVENVHLVGLDTSKPNSPTGEVSNEQLEWLKKDIAANKDKFIIIAAHHPLLPPPPYDGGPPLDDYIVPNGSDVREIIGASPAVRLVLSGHLYLNKVQLERDIYHVSCAGLDVYPCQYKYFKVGKDAITMESYEVSFGALVKKGLKALSSSAFATKINRQNPAKIVDLCQGAPEDQNALLLIGATKSVQELPKKQQKEDRQKRDEELDRQAELARNKGKGKKGKGEDEGKEESGKKAKKDSGEEAAAETKPEKKPDEKTESKGEAAPADKQEVKETSTKSEGGETKEADSPNKNIENKESQQ